MKILVIYDSVYGNTEQVAGAIGGVFAARMEAETLRAADWKPEKLQGINCLVVGSPTQKFRPTSLVSSLLDGVPAQGLKGIRVAAFDTRLSLDDIESSIEKFAVKLGGYAARGIAGRLVKLGGHLVVPPEGFLVKGMEGPLVPGELERAAGWAGQVLSFLDTTNKLGF